MGNIPNSNLGLSVSPHEVAIAVRLWLKIKMSPSPLASVLCSCGQHIDTLEITLVVVLVQSAHVDTMHWQKLFSRSCWLRTEML